ncbi:MAG: 30S ribosomal protein S13 [Patescibacteria group bacterium]|jgi:small subunit ribosomal protein S13
MARIAGVNIPNEKKLNIALTYIFGIGSTTSRKIIEKSGVSGDIRVKDLSETDVEKIRKAIAAFKVEGDLRMMISQNIKRLKEVGAYRGVRHIKGLPARGQRTKTNARTKRGKKITVGSGRKPAAQKT